MNHSSHDLGSWWWIIGLAAPTIFWGVFAAMLMIFGDGIK